MSSTQNPSWPCHSQADAYYDDRGGHSAHLRFASQSCRCLLCSTQLLLYRHSVGLSGACLAPTGLLGSCHSRFQPLVCRVCLALGRCCCFLCSCHCLRVVKRA